MAVRHEHQQVIAGTVSPSLGGLEQVGDLGLVQEVLAPLVGVSDDRRATFDISPLRRRRRAHRNPTNFRAVHAPLLTKYTFCQKWSRPTPSASRDLPGERP